MLTTLHRRPPLDRFPNDVRSVRRRIGRWIYLALVIAFFAWLIDLFVGPLVRLRAEGLVSADRIAIGVPFATQVVEVLPPPGARVQDGEVLAVINSPQVLETLASLSARVAENGTRAAELRMKAEVAKLVSPIASERAHEAARSLAQIRDIKAPGSVSLYNWATILRERYDSQQVAAEISAEQKALVREISELDRTQAEAVKALDSLRASYADGILAAPADGIVGPHVARPGEVLAPGQSPLDLYVGQPYVLAYLTTGALFEVATGQPVLVADGFKEARGHIVEVLPMADKLPPEFQKSFEPAARGQLLRIELDDRVAFPLFSKVMVKNAGWAALIPGRATWRWLSGVMPSRGPRQATETAGR